MLTTILLVFSFVFFVLAAGNVPAHPRLNYIGAGLACWIAATLFGPLLR
jgi:hypothetical protein